MNRIVKPATTASEAERRGYTVKGDARPDEPLGLSNHAGL